MSSFTTPIDVPQARGLALPAVKSQSGGYFATKTDTALAAGDLLLLLFTPIGARPFRRRWGSALPRLLFDAQLNQDDSLFRFYITDAVQQHLPNVEITDVQINRGSTELSFLIKYRMRGQVDQESLDVSYDLQSSLRSIGGSNL